MSRQRTAWLVAILLVALSVWATRDGRAEPPSRPTLAAVVGAPLGAPQYEPSTPLRRLWKRARLYWSYFTMPIPNQMATSYDGQAWTYPVTVAPDYAPPEGSPLRCRSEAEWLSCTGTASGWRYHLGGPRGGGEGAFVAERVGR